MQSDYFNFSLAPLNWGSGEYLFVDQSQAPYYIFDDNFKLTIKYRVLDSEIVGHKIIERFRLIHDGDVVSGISNSSFTYDGNEKTVIFNLSIRDYLTDNGLTGLFELISSTDYSIIKAANFTFEFINSDVLFKKLYNFKNSNNVKKDFLDYAIRINCPQNEKKYLDSSCYSILEEYGYFGLKNTPFLKRNENNAFLCDNLTPMPDNLFSYNIYKEDQDGIIQTIKTPIPLYITNKKNTNFINFPKRNRWIDTENPEINFFPFCPAYDETNKKFIVSVGKVRDQSYDPPAIIFKALYINGVYSGIQYTWAENFPEIKFKYKEVDSTWVGGIDEHDETTYSWYSPSETDSGEEAASWLQTNYHNFVWQTLSTTSPLIYIMLQGAGGSGGDGFASTGVWSDCAGADGGNGGTFGAFAFYLKDTHDYFILYPGEAGLARFTGLHVATNKYVGRGNTGGFSFLVAWSPGETNVTDVITCPGGLYGGPASDNGTTFFTDWAPAKIHSYSEKIGTLYTKTGTAGGNGGAETGYVTGIPKGHKSAEDGKSYDDTEAVTCTGFYKSISLKKAFTYKPLENITELAEALANSLANINIDLSDLSQEVTVQIGEGGKENYLGGNSAAYSSDGGGGGAAVCSGRIKDSSYMVGYGGGGFGGAAEPATVHGEGDGCPGAVAIIAFSDN